MRTNLHHQGGGLATFVMGRSGNLPTPDAEVDKLGEETGGAEAGPAAGSTDPAAEDTEAGRAESGVGTYSGGEAPLLRPSPTAEGSLG